MEVPAATQITYAKTAPKTPIKARNASFAQFFVSITPVPTRKLTPSPYLSKTPSVGPSFSDTTEPETSTTDIGQLLMKQINDFRASKGLGPLSIDGNTCSFAVARAGEIIGNFNHDGFRSRIDSGSLPYPSYSSVAENIAMNPNPNDVVPSWINSPGHNENMRKDVPYGCVGKNGNYYVFEAWKP